MSPPTALLQPLPFGSLTLKNRVAMAPMTRARAPDLLATLIMAEYYSARASAGLVITEGTHVSPMASGWPHVPGIYSEAQVEAWKKVTEAVHEKGGVVFMQLWHQGRQSNKSYHGGEPAVSASDVAMQKPYYNIDGSKPEVSEPPRALTLEEVESTKEDFVRAAKNAIAAGFDGVEIHSANGYLLDQFLQAHTNKRTDAYGGSVENRSKLSVEITEAVVAAIGADKTGIRFSPNGIFGEMGGPDYREQFTDVISKVAKLKPVYIHVMDGPGFGMNEWAAKDPMTLAEIRKIVGKDQILMGNCGKSVEEGDGNVASGDADMISFGRPYIGNPDFVEKITKGEPAPSDNVDMKYWYYPHLWAPEPDSKGYTDI
eukprot:CAMPEP_0174892180 /NCGR_PEP_ID=MMETSP0167-20121228/7186_1 /TAXON_ID=38298 /ORGANISM="Rhodella maculata, Strain CCMP736" /LENGTH=370 /DNA_ID=CAMNT_0016130609 /DNA_START=37 /DNA_END=1149 /DNA_ORIENTATION=-